MDSEKGVLFGLSPHENVKPKGDIFCIQFSSFSFFTFSYIHIITKTKLNKKTPNRTEYTLITMYKKKLHRDKQFCMYKNDVKEEFSK